MKNKMYRQGDVLLVAATKPSVNLKKIEPKNGRVILAFGEATGHHHSIDSAHSQEWVDDAGVTWIECRQAVELLHQEHDAISLVAGWYRKIQQREYSPEAIRNVAD